MNVFTEKVGGKYCPSFQFHGQKFHLQGFDTKEEAEWMEIQLKVCFSNYGRHVIRKFSSQLLEKTSNQLNELIKQIEDE